MARRPATLTAAFVRTVSKPGVYGDGHGSRGLSLRVHRMKSGRLSRTWRQRLRVAGRLTTTGLGRYPEVSLAEARHKAIENARAIGQGVDPRGGGVPTFREAAEETIRLHAESWKAGSPLPKVNGNGTTHHRALPHGEVPAALRRSANGTNLRFSALT